MLDQKVPADKMLLDIAEFFISVGFRFLSMSLESFLPGFCFHHGFKNTEKNTVSFLNCLGSRDVPCTLTPSSSMETQGCLWCSYLGTASSLIQPPGIQRLVTSPRTSTQIEPRGFFFLLFCCFFNCSFQFGTC